MKIYLGLFFAEEGDSVKGFGLSFDRGLGFYNRKRIIINFYFLKRFTMYERLYK